MPGSAIGAILQGMGPGLLSGIGNALNQRQAPPSQSSSPPPGAPDPKDPKTATPNSFKKGGEVLKTGVALVHKGEVVVPKEDSNQDEHDISFHRAMAHLHKGGLHRALGIPEDQDIPKDRIKAAKGSSNGHVRAMATLAENMSHWK